MSQNVCLEKYPCYTEISLCVYIAASSTGVRFRRLPTARHGSREVERGPAQPAKPLSPFPKSLSLLAFLIPKQSPNRGTLPPFLRGKGGFSSLRKAGKAFLATHSHFHPLFLLLRPPQVSFAVCPLWGRAEAAFSRSIQLDIWIIFPPFLVSALPSKQNSAGHSQLVENQW